MVEVQVFMLDGWGVQSYAMTPSLRQLDGPLTLLIVYVLNVFINLQVNKQSMINEMYILHYKHMSHRWLSCSYRKSLKSTTKIAFTILWQWHKTIAKDSYVDSATTNM